MPMETKKRLIFYKSRAKDLVNFVWDQEIISTDCWSRKSCHWWTTAKIAMLAVDRALIPAIRAFELHRTENQVGSVELICLMVEE